MQNHDRGEKMRNPDRHNSPLVSPDYLQGKQSGGKERKDHRKRSLWPLSGRPLDREERSKDYIKGFSKSYYWDTEDLSMSDKVDVVVRMDRAEYEAIDWSTIDRAEALLEGVRRLQPNIQIFDRYEQGFAVFLEGLEVGEAWFDDNQWFFVNDADDQDVNLVPPEYQEPDAIAQYVARQWQKQQEISL